MNRKALLLLCLLSLSVSLLALKRDAHAVGTNIFVSAGGEGTSCLQGTPCKLDAALDKANAGDRLYFGAGTYTGTGDNIITIDKGLSLYGGWDGAKTGAIKLAPITYPTIFDGEGERNSLRINYNNDAFPISINGFKFINGYSQNGGAIEIIQGNVLIENNKFEDNYSVNKGGAVFVGSGFDVVIRGNEFTRNEAWQGGGGITINVPTSAYPDVIIDDNLFQDNEAVSYGGGIYVMESNAVTILGNTFTKNNAWYGGGGVYIGRSEGHTPNLLIECNLFSGNSINEYYSGAALRIENHTARITKNLFKDHTAPNTAVIDIGSGNTAPSEISNNMFVRSITAIYLGSTSTGNHKIWNNTIVGAIEAGINISAVGPPVQIINNIIVDSEDSIVSWSGDLTGSNNLFYSNNRNLFLLSNYEVGKDPLFVNSASDDYHLQKESPAIDAGTTVDLLFDFDGEKRPSGSGYDIGADEVMSWLYLFLPLILR